MDDINCEKCHNKFFSFKVNNKLEIIMHCIKCGYEITINNDE